MNEAPCSWRVSTYSIDDLDTASVKRMFSSPGIPKTCVTPSFSRHSTISSAVVRVGSPIGPSVAAAAPCEFESCASAQSFVDRLVTGNHALQTEAFLDMRSTCLRIDIADKLQGGSEVRGLVADVPGFAVDDDLCDGAGPQGHDGCASRHRLDHHQPERLFPTDRKQQAPRRCEKFTLRQAADRPDDLIAVR